MNFRKKYLLFVILICLSLGAVFLAPKAIAQTTGSACPVPGYNCTTTTYEWLSRPVGDDITGAGSSCTQGGTGYLFFCCPLGQHVNDTNNGCVRDTTQPPEVIGIENPNTQTTPADPLDQADLDLFNPLLQPNAAGDVNEANATELSTPGGILSRLLTFAFPLAGLILFVMLVWAGWEILVGATDKKSIDAGKQRATAAVVGFFLLFIAYWLVQLLEVIFLAEIL